MLSHLKSLLATKVRGDHWVHKLVFHVRHPLFPALFFSPIIFGFSLYGLLSAKMSVGMVLAFFVGGMLLWTFAEYCLHRFFLHDVLYGLKNVPEPWQTVLGGFHPAHHNEPNDEYLVIAPPMAALFVVGIFYLVLLAVTWNWLAAGVILSGILTSYVFYEWVHYGTHFFKWKNFALGRYYKRYHLYHHFKGPNEAFGVTNPFWDHVFRTPKNPQPSRGLKAA